MVSRSKTAFMCWLLLMPCVATPVFSAPLEAPALTEITPTPPSLQRKNLSRWKKIHQQHMQSQQRGISFDLMEVLSSTDPVPALPVEVIRKDPHAQVSRLSVVQKVDLDHHQQWMVVADLQEGYLLELQKNENQEKIIEAFAYQIRNKELTRLPIPLSESIAKVAEIMSSQQDIWALSVAHPDYFDVLVWDAQGRPELAREKKASSHGALVRFAYKDQQVYPSWAQLIQSSEGKTKHTTVLFMRVDAGLKDQSWAVEDVVKDALSVISK